MEHNDFLARLVHDYQQSHISRRIFMRRGLELGLSISVISSLLAACGGGDDSDDEDEDGSSEVSSGAIDSTPESVGQSGESESSGEPKTGGTLREGYDLDFSQLDPIDTNWYDPAFFTLYDAVITSDPEGGLVPQLAEAWEFSEDNLSVTFTIQEGLMFHSGRPLNAQAIKEDYDTVMDPNSGSGLGPTLFAPVESVEAPDDQTLVINLKHPYFEVLNVVKTGYWRIANMEQRAELGEQYGQQGVDGSGPFTFGEWVPGSHVTVNRWDDYPGSIVPYIENKGTAHLDSIRWEAILEAAQRAIRIENGEIDTLHAPAFQDVARLQENSDLNVIALREWSGYILNLNFEREDLDFHQLQMRQAVSHAIDRAGIVTTLLFDQGEPLYGPITSADKYYTEEVEQYNQFDLDTARQLVAELGWEPGSDDILTKNGTRMEFNLVLQAESFNQELGSAIQAQLREIGMDVSVQALDRASYFTQLGEGADSSIFYYLWPVPIDVALLFVGTATIPRPNWSRASIQEVDDAIEAWQSAANEEELIAAAEQFQLAVATNLPTVPLINRNNIWVQRSNVHGWMPHQWNLYAYYNDVWLE